ncbi:transporter substrate-binding domain-containing protein [uncultured Thiocystis sp.]|uniref:ATP-binding protein n=1 Tax=uncultured Thiocystis sp. TaxID=1202134 RepID=UPI0025D563D4|nr:transporter substrate-binding domain-containing protein [uncultured Thiocystis sp.]
MDPDWAPVEFLDPEGRASGIGPEYLARIEPLLGVRFASVPTANWAEALRWLDQGEVDLLPSASQTPERRKRFHFSAPHLAFPIAIFAPVEAPFLGNLEALAGKQVGVVDQHAVQEWLRQDYPEIRRVPFANTEAALREVAERRVDAFVDNLVTTSQAIGRTGLVQVRVAGMTSYEFALSMAVRQDWPILAGILEKAIAAIPERDRKSIYSRWVQVQPPATVDYRLLWNVLAGFALVLLVILLWNWSLRREMAKRQRAERILAESERRYREMVESASANFNFYSLTPEGAFLYISPSLRDWFGIDPARIMGMPWDAIAHWSADTRRRGLSALRQCQAGEIPAPVTLELTVRGARLQLISHARPVRDDQGRVVRIEGITINMTERLKLEEDLRRAIATAEQANRTKSEFLANMSHEIRTPMNGIMGMLQLCLETVLSEQQRTFLEKAQGASRSLLDLLNDILDLSKVEAGQLTLESTGFALKEVIAHLDTAVGHSARDKGLAFRVEIAPEVPAWLVGDPLRLGQVLVNLSGNAVKFTPRGEVRISIRVLDGRRDRIHLAFEVRDTGIGIAEARIGELFQPFQQADSSITRRYGGTGLGLSISRQLVERMEGRIRVESLPGEGSNFRFDAWFGTEPMAAAALAKGHGLAQAERPRQPILDLTGKRLLVVEDNLLNQEVVKTFLEQAGAGVEVANHGAAAVDLIERRGAGAFDAVLMDIQMPEMDGYTATRRLRELPGGASVPIIGLTAHVRREEIALIHAAGMNDHVGKPFDPAMLLSVIARHLHLPLNQTEAETSAPRDAAPDAPLPARPGIAVAGALARVDDQVSILRE